MTFDHEGKTVRVSWFECDCDWITKYCEEAHRVSANIPVEVLKEYRTCGL